MSWFGRKRGDRRPMPLSERLYRRFILKYHGRYLITELQLRARQQSVDYITAEMGDALIFEDRWALLRYAASEAPAEGLMLECGVADGASLRHLATAIGARHFHGFDSFEGLPENWAGTFEHKGKFGRGGALPEVPANVALHKGWFEQTLPAFLGGTRDVIRSAGGAVRLNVFGFAIVELAISHPFDRPDRRPQWQLGLLEGF